MSKSFELARQQQSSKSTEALPNLLYHTHLHLASQSPPKPRSSRPTSCIQSPPSTTMVTHIAEQASDQIKVQTASAIQYHRAHISSEVAEVTVHSPSLGGSRQRRNQSPNTPTPQRSNNMAPSQRMRHVRHPSNVPLYTPSPNSSSTRSRRLRASLKPLFHIFTPTEPSSPPALDTNKQWDESRRLGSKAKILQEANPNTRQSRGRSFSSSFSTSKDSHHSSSPQQRPTRYFSREQSNAAILEELKCEGLLGGGPTRSRKRKGRSDSPNLEKPLPPLVPSITRRNSEELFYWEGNNCEEKYWAGVADDIARRVSMLTQ